MKRSGSHESSLSHESEAPKAAEVESKENESLISVETAESSILFRDEPKSMAEPRERVDDGGSDVSLELTLGFEPVTRANHVVPVKKRKDFFPHGNDDECYLSVNPPDRIPDIEIHPSEPHWLNDFSGVMKNVYGPVTATKTIYEDEQGYLIIISLPFVDLQSVKVSWRNTLTHGIIKVSG